MASIITSIQRSATPYRVSHLCFYRLFVCGVALCAPHALQAIAAATLLVVSQYHLALKIVFGNMFSPEVPRPWVLLAGWLFCAFVLLVVLTLLADVTRCVVRAIGGPEHADMLDRPAVHAATAVLAAALAAVGVSNASVVPQARQVTLTVRDLPPVLQGFRIVQLSDLHVHPFFKKTWLTDVVARTNAASPDLIVVTGDLIDGTVEARWRDVAPLNGLCARYGVIASLGNHEYYFGAGRWRQAMEQLGMRVLVNAHVSIDVGGATLNIAAVTDPSARPYGKPPPDLAQAIRGIPAEQPLFLLSHRPTDMVQAAKGGVDVELSGHTHGGMVRGPDLVPKVANGGVVSGLYDYGSLQLYVSNGTGIWNGFPIRLGVPPEITVFTLSASAPAPHQ